MAGITYRKAARMIDRGIEFDTYTALQLRIVVAEGLVAFLKGLREVPARLTDPTTVLK